MISRRALLSGAGLLALTHHADAGWAPFMASGSGPPIGWSEFLIGAGGNVQGGAIANDGTALIKMDTYGFCIGVPKTMLGVGGATKWRPIGSQNLPVSMQGFPNTSLSTISGAPGGTWDVGIAPTNSQFVAAFVGGFLIASNDQANTFVKTAVTQDTTMTTNTSFTGGDIHRSIAFDPQNPNVAFAGTSQQGLWTTSNYNVGGGTWTLVSTSSVPIATTGRTVTQGSCPVLFDPNSAVTGGKKQGVYAAPYGHGVYHSTDGGSTWALTTSGPTTVCSMDIGSDGQVYTVNASGVLQTYNGTTWSTVTPGTTPLAVTVDPTTAGKVWATTGAGAMMLSTNHGTSWTTAFGTNNNWLTATDVPWLATTSSTTTFVDLGWMMYDPSQSGVYIGFCGVCPLSFTPSSVAVQQYTSISAGTEQLTCLDFICPPGATPILFSWDRPIIKSKGFGAKLYPTTYFPQSGTINTNTRGFAGDWASDLSGTVISCAWNYSGSNGPGVVSLDNGATWASWGTQPTSDVGTCCAAATSLEWIVLDNGLSTPTGQIYFTANGGSTWASATGAPTTGWANADFATPTYLLCADRNTAGTLYAWNNTNGFYSSTNGGSTWTHIAAVPFAAGQAFRLRSVKGQASNLIASNANGSSPALMRSVNAGSTWTNPNSNVTKVFAMDVGAMKPGGSYPAIYIFGILSGVNGYYQSNDAGVTWTLLTDATYGSWPIGNIDQPFGIAASPDTYGYFAVCMSGSGTVQGYFPT